MFPRQRDTGVAEVTDRSDHPPDGSRPRRVATSPLERKLHLPSLSRTQFNLDISRFEPRVRRAEDVLSRRYVDQLKLSTLVRDGEVGVIDDAEVTTLPPVHVAFDGDEDLGMRGARQNAPHRRGRGCRLSVKVALAWLKVGRVHHDVTVHDLEGLPCP